MGRVIVLMGVSGCGKSTIGRLLAEHYSCDFVEGDAYHPPENLAKMAAGMPLNDADRMPWLKKLNEVISDKCQDNEKVILSCSALKQSYRDILRNGLDDLIIFYLHGDFQMIQNRLQLRVDHYMKSDMLIGQFETLEQPEPGEAFEISIDQSPEEIVIEIIANL